MLELLGPFEPHLVEQGFDSSDRTLVHAWTVAGPTDTPPSGGGDLLLGVDERDRRRGACALAVVGMYLQACARLRERDRHPREATCASDTVPSVTSSRTPPLVRRLAWTMLALFVVFVAGVVGYMVVEGWSFSDALYMTVITMTTVGFREVRPLDQSGQWLTLTIVLLGVALALVGISLTAALVAQAEIGGATRRKRMDKRIEALRGHFIVCAYGRVGRAAARELEAAGLPFVVVDPKEDLRERMEEDALLYLVDDPSLEPVLRRAGVERARGLLCAVDSDATNVFITLTARQMNPDLFIVARASDPGSTERLERAGADRVVSPFVSSGRHMVRMAQIRASLTSSTRAPAPIADPRRGTAHR